MFNLLFVKIILNVLGLVKLIDDDEKSAVTIFANTHQLIMNSF
jgi:hypothetical protein